MNRALCTFREYLQHYNPRKYWKRRNYIVKSSWSGGLIKKLKLIFFLFYVKRMDAFNHSSMGTEIGFGAVFADIPNFPHGMYDIIVAKGSIIGKNVTIFHGVTIGNDNKLAENVPLIGDNVVIFPGAVIVGKVKIGNNVKIGANAVVVEDVPDNSTVVCEKARILLHKNEEL